METTLRAFGKTTRQTVMVCIFTPMAQNMKEAGKTTCRMVLESRYGKKIITLNLLRTDGSRYEGSYKNGRKEGMGVYFWSDGSKYLGNWSDNKIQGFGRYTWLDGRVQS
jgi:hypothetical protein